MDDASVTAQLGEIARGLEEQHTTDQVLASALDVAVRDIESCDAAAFTIVRKRSRLETPVATSEEARRGDALQYETGEGPCLDAVWEHLRVRSPDLRDDPRWPTWGTRMAEDVGFRSLAAFRLYTRAGSLGALNLYSRTVGAFDEPEMEYAAALAGVVSVALASAKQADQLGAALETRTVIATAVGVVMERYQLDNDRAFAVLTRLSSTTNRKLRDVAADLVAGGRISELSPDAAPPPG